jgi:hypothetical protein
LIFVRISNDFDQNGYPESQKKTGARAGVMGGPPADPPDN